MDVVPPVAEPAPTGAQEVPDNPGVQGGEAMVCRVFNATNGKWEQGLPDSAFTEFSVMLRTKKTVSLAPGVRMWVPVTLPASAQIPRNVFVVPTPSHALAQGGLELKQFSLRFAHNERDSGPAVLMKNDSNAYSLQVR